MTAHLPENARGVQPSDYRAHLNAVLAREAAWRARRTGRRLRVLVVALVALVVGVWLLMLL